MCGAALDGTSFPPWCRPVPLPVCLTVGWAPLARLTGAWSSPARLSRSCSRASHLRRPAFVVGMWCSLRAPLSARSCCDLIVAGAFQKLATSLRRCSAISRLVWRSDVEPVCCGLTRFLLEASRACRFSIGAVDPCLQEAFRRFAFAVAGSLLRWSLSQLL